MEFHSLLHTLSNCIDAALNRQGVAYLLGGCLAAIVGFSVALIGATITTLNQWQQALWDREENELERKHASEKAEAERIHDLRKEYILPYLKALAEAMDFISNIPTKTSQEIKDSKPAMDFQKAVGQLVLAASQELMSASSSVNMALTSIMHQAIVLRSHFDNFENRINNELKVTDSEIDSVRANLTDLVKQISQLDREGTGKSPKRMQLHITATGIQEYLSALHDRRNNLLDSVADALANTDIKVKSICVGIEPYVTNLILQLRQEIGMPLNEDWFRKVQRVDRAKFQETIAGVYSQVREAFNQGSPKPQSKSASDTPSNSEDPQPSPSAPPANES